MMYKESDIMHETGSYFVLSLSHSYTVFKNIGMVSTSVQSFAKDADGLSLAIAYCNYKGRPR